MVGSYLGELFKIEYTLTLSVKFDTSWYHFDGNYVLSMPLHIMSDPRLVASKEEYRLPKCKEWQPYSGLESPVSVFLENAQLRTDYFNKVLSANW